MAYQEGDTSPPHTNVHNDVWTQLDELSTEFEIPVVLPPVVGLGDVGHVDHHNLFTTAIAELSKHECEDGLDGLGGWAEITAVSGSPKRYAYNDGGMDWVAFEWTDDGDVTTTEGLADLLIVGGGAAAGSSFSGGAGGVLHGVQDYTAATHTILVGTTPTGGNQTTGSRSAIGPNSIGGGIVRTASPNGFLDFESSGYGAGAGSTGNATDRDTGGPGFVSSITGTSLEYGQGGGLYRSEAEYAALPPGSGSDRQNNSDVFQYRGTDGVVIIRVPAAQAAGVDPGSWVTRIDYYAEVTDGLVTDLYQERFYGDDTVRTENGRFASPEQPDDLIPCDPSVAEGWTYADGEFTPPPPDPSWREQAIEALKQQLKDLQKDTK